MGVMLAIASANKIVSRFLVQQCDTSGKVNLLVSCEAICKSSKMQIGGLINVFANLSDIQTYNSYRPISKTDQGIRSWLAGFAAHTIMENY